MTDWNMLHPKDYTKISFIYCPQVGLLLEGVLLKNIIIDDFNICHTCYSLLYLMITNPSVTYS